MDFKKIYTATVRLEFSQLLFTIIILKRLYLWQLDFVTAYLDSNINFNVYIK